MTEEKLLRDVMAIPKFFDVEAYDKEESIEDIDEKLIPRRDKPGEVAKDTDWEGFMPKGSGEVKYDNGCKVAESCSAMMTKDEFIKYMDDGGGGEITDYMRFDSEPVQMPDGDMTEIQVLINEEINFIRGFLLEKNRKYGNSALEPIRIFSKADPIEQLRVRIDDKIKRITTCQADDEEDSILDLIGYLILLRVAKHQE